MGDAVFCPGRYCLIECILDYETRSGAPLEKTGAIVYAKHPSTSILCLGYKINDGPSLLWIPERSPMPEDLWHAFRHGVLYAHNAAFERAITKYVLTRYDTLTPHQRHYLSKLPIGAWRCLAAKAAMCSLPRKLEMAAIALELTTQKDVKGNRLIKKVSKPRKPSKNNPKLWWDNKKELRAIYRYCLTDVEAEYELHQSLPDLSPYEQGVWELDQKINDRGILIDVPAVKKVLELVHAEMKLITEQVKELSDGEVSGPGQVARMLKWVNDRGANIANLRADTIRDRLLSDDISSQVREMLLYRQSGSKTSTAKYVSMLAAVDDDYRAKELLLYCGAIPTARWAGKRIQVQNFPRPTIKEPGEDFFDSNRAIALAIGGGREALSKRYGNTKVMSTLVSIIRGMLIASPGKELFCADFAAVEARLAFWLADHFEGIQAFKENRKLYEEMAVEAFGVPMEQVTKNSLERFVGKETILGAQYGLGHVKHLKNCHQKGVPQVTSDMAKKAIYTYRKIHHPIPTFWKNIEAACIQAILNPGKRYPITKVVAYMSDKWLNIKLPSGRRLRYFKPRITQKRLASGRMVPEIRYWTVELHKWQEISIWGGQFFNHITQGTARDLMTNAIINIEDAGYEFLISAHDEGVAERTIGEGNLKQYISLMTKLPAWAKGAPITAEGWCGPRYKK